jgi:pimeloyl-ACP methyl ester carboxylesterase
VSHTPSVSATPYEDFARAPDGTRLFCEHSGDGPVVVLCDGIACDGFIWKYLRPALTARHRVLHWHYRGHGRSGAPVDPSRVTVSDHAADLHAVLDHMGVERATLIGHSMGTQVCLEAYRQRPERAAGLVLVCGSYGRITRTFHGTDALVHWLPAVIDQVERHPQIARALWSRGPSELFAWGARLFGEVDALRLRSEDLVPYFEHIATLDPVMFFKMLRAAGEHSAERILTSITAPTLVVAAERDSFTPVRYAEQMARQIPDAELVMVYGASHTAPIEQPEIIDRRIVDFLERRVDAAR